MTELADQLRAYIDEQATLDPRRDQLLAELDDLERRAAAVAEAFQHEVPGNGGGMMVSCSQFEEFIESGLIEHDKHYLRTIEFLLGEVQRLERREAEGGELLRVAHGSPQSSTARRRWARKRDDWIEGIEPVRQPLPDDWLAEQEQGEP